ncbi:ABC transporter ATP-binding protein [Marinicauda algicola]|uniref:ABC transporter ATP-binding protein n=1 Tax=Marinicauda algicola TaxID=2029849 RepID=A0A4S2GY94_9PROT|nr:ABC transporter ATP-binding protein [Marinicauda algicola]TGY88135.1 ABC transporter ATP-binding protein [Marinicauda algicola]
MSEERDTVIEVEGLTKRFGGLTAVDDFSMRVPKGAIYGFLGPNGSGKTTTIRLMVGLMRPDAGGGTALGYDIATQAREIKQRIGYMTQHFSLYSDLTVRENLDFVSRLHALEGRKQAVEAALEEYNLDPRADQLAGTLSGGWKQRLALAASQMHRPQLLLLDEPTAGVDPKARRDFWDRIRGLTRKGVTVLVSTHYMDEAVQCDYIAFISAGKKLVDAPSGEVPERVGLYTRRIEGPDLAGLRDELEGLDGIDQIARFGSALHVSGRDEERLERALRPWVDDEDYTVEPVRSGLEEAFIWLMAEKREAAP